MNKEKNHVGWEEMEIMQARCLTRKSVHPAITTVLSPVIQDAAGVVDLSGGATRVSGRSAAAKYGMSTLAADVA